MFQITQKEGATFDSRFLLLSGVCEALPVAVLCFDGNLTIRYANRAACRLLGATEAEVVGRNLEDCFSRFFTHTVEEYRRTSPVYKLVAGGGPVNGVERIAKDGRTFLLYYASTAGGGGRPLFIVTLVETTSHLLGREMAAAFPLIFPDTVERRLRCTPEYTDRYDPETGEIVITGVIPDGCYRHVVNCLYLLAELEKLGVLAYTGVGRRELVETMVLHDAAKTQPRLAVGRRVRPAEVFEDGKHHAARGALLAVREHGVSPTVETLIRYHHHREDELPPAFPPALRPAYRLVRLVDGLSAAITRRGARVHLEAQGSAVAVREENPHPGYNGYRVIDILAGEACGGNGGRGGRRQS
ncbi:MAG: PAS domain-containing protein [Bacillota bacterium]